MTEEKGKSIFDLTPEEREKGFIELTKKAIQRAFDKGAPISYQDDRCPTDNHFVHHYKEGRQELVLLDVKTGKTTVIKEL